MTIYSKYILIERLYISAVNGTIVILLLIEITISLNLFEEMLYENQLSVYFFPANNKWSKKISEISSVEFLKYRCTTNVLEFQKYDLILKCKKIVLFIFPLWSGLTGNPIPILLPLFFYLSFSFITVIVEFLLSLLSDVLLIDVSIFMFFFDPSLFCQMSYW